MMWSISKSENNAVFMKQKGNIVGKIWDIAVANNSGCIKIMMNGLDKIMRLVDFNAEDNEYSSLFAGHLGSRSSFVERWRTLKKSGQSKTTALKRTYSKNNPFEFKGDAASDELNEPMSYGVATKKNIHVEVHRSSVSDWAEVGSASPIIAEPVGVIEDNLTDFLNVNDGAPPKTQNLNNTASPEKNYGENDNSSKKSTDDTNEVFVEAIHKKLKGYMVLPVSKLKQPSFINLLREPDIKHVKQLEKEFLERPGNYFQLMVVNVCGQMEDENFESCTLEVIGGNHSRKALQNIISDDKTSNPALFEKRMCIVYTNLNPDEAKYIANQHNQVRKFGTDLDLVDRATCFRYALFEKAGFMIKEDTISMETPSNKDILRKWKEGLQLCMGSVSRKTLNNRFQIEMKLAQLPSEVWVQFLDFSRNLRKEIKKDKISGRVLKPITGVSSENLLTFLHKYNSGKINFKQLTSLCTESKCNEAKKTEEKSECDQRTSVIGPEVETIVETLEGEVREGEAVNYNILIEALKETANKEKKNNIELKLKNSELKEALEISDRENKEIKKNLAERMLFEEKLQDEICQLKGKLNQVTKECRILTEKQSKLTKRKITTVDDREEMDMKKAAIDHWDFKEGQEGLDTGMVVAITPFRQRDIINGEPWLAITNEVSKSKIKVSWLKGRYDTNWILNPDFKGCAPDSIYRNRVACSFRYIPDQLLPCHIVDKLKEIFKH